MEYRKCSKCKLNYRIELLTTFQKNNYPSCGLVYICKVCLKKFNHKEQIENSEDKYVLNELRYSNKKQNVESTEELLNLQLLNIKLKRELKNGK